MFHERGALTLLFQPTASGSCQWGRRPSNRSIWVALLEVTSSSHEAFCSRYRPTHESKTTQSFCKFHLSFSVPLLFSLASLYPTVCRRYPAGGRDVDVRQRRTHGRLRHESRFVRSPPPLICFGQALRFCETAGHEIRALQRVVDSGSAIAEAVAVPLGN